MSGTQRTQSFLINTSFPSNGPPGGIGPTQFKDLTVSGAWYNISKSPFRPDYPPYNAKFDGATDDTTAWTSMFTDITTAGGGLVLMPYGVSIVQAGQLNVPNNTTVIGQGSSPNGGTIIRRKAASNGVVLDVTGTSDAALKFGVCLRDFAVETSDGSTGANIRWMYGSKYHTENIRVFGTQDSGFLIVACEDCYWYGNFINWAGQSGTASGGGTTGSSALLISGGIASSGFGFSSNGCNNLNFFGTRIETFAAEGISIQQNLGSHQNSQIKFFGTKLETTILAANSANQWMINMSGDARDIQFHGTYIAMDAATGNIGFIDLVNFTPNMNCVMRDTQVWIGTAGQVRNIIFQFPGNPLTHLIDHLSIDGVGGATLYGNNSGALLFNGNSPASPGVPYRHVHDTTGSGALFASPSYPPGVFDLPPQPTATRGDASPTVTVSVDNAIQVFSTPLTANRTVTLSSAGAFGGAYFRIVRTAAASGTWSLTVNSKALAAGQWADNHYSTSAAAWVETGSGSL